MRQVNATEQYDLLWKFKEILFHKLHNLFCLNLTLLIEKLERAEIPAMQVSTGYEMRGFVSWKVNRTRLDLCPKNRDNLRYV